MYRKYNDPFVEGYLYHIFNRTINKELLFKSNRNFDFFLGRWKKYIGDLMEVYAYCLLPTHFHFLAKVPESVSNPKRVTNTGSTNAPDINKKLEKQFELYFRSYAQAFNKENNRTGSLFQKRFKRIQVDDESYYTSLFYYIHLNPLHHDCTQKPLQWRYSSFAAIMSDKPTLVNREAFLSYFGSRQDFMNGLSDPQNFVEPKNYWIE